MDRCRQNAPTVLLCCGIVAAVCFGYVGIRSVNAEAASLVRGTNGRASTPGAEPAATPSHTVASGFTAATGSAPYEARPKASTGLADPLYTKADSAAFCRTLQAGFPIAPSWNVALKDSIMKGREWQLGDARFSPSRRRVLADVFERRDPYLGVRPVDPKPVFNSYGSQCAASLMSEIMARLDAPPKVVVEVGTFVGSAVRRVWGPLVKRGGSGLVLCVDTWQGTIGMRLRSKEYYLRLQHGMPSVYNSFMTNMINSGLQDCVLPLAMASIEGARLLWVLGYQVDVVYVDSAHERGETAIELYMYWQLLRSGGVLLGDDLDFKAVNRDVRVFAECVGAELHVFCNKKNPAAAQWIIKKP